MRVPTPPWLRAELRRRRDRFGDFWTVRLPFHPAAIQALRNAGGMWNARLGVWLFPVSRYSHTIVKGCLPGATRWDDRTSVSDRLPELEDLSRQAVTRFTKWLEHKRYRSNTVVTNRDAVTVFLRFWQQFGKFRIDQFTADDINTFNFDDVVANGYSRSYHNQLVNALKLFLHAVENRSVLPESIERPRGDFRLPHLLSKEEVKRIIERTANPKHRTMLIRIYACGLRRGELLALRLEDIDSNRKVLWIRCGKGARDRMLPRSEKVLVL